MKMIKNEKSRLRKIAEAVAIAIDVVLIAAIFAGFCIWLYLGFRPLNLG